MIVQLYKCQKQMIFSILSIYLVVTIGMISLATYVSSRDAKLTMLTCPQSGDQLTGKTFHYHHYYPTVLCM